VFVEKSISHAWSLISNKLVAWYEVAIQNLPNFIVAIGVVCVFGYLAGWIGRGTQTLLSKNVKNRSLVSLGGTIIKLATVLLGIFISLGILHLDKTVTSLLAGAGVIGLALGFAFQDIAANFVSGILIAFREPYRIGDLVEVEGYIGEVKAIDLRTTQIETFQGIEIFIPNQMMITKPLQNISGTPRRRVDLKVGVSYAENLRKVTEVIREALLEIEHRIKEREVEVFFEEFGGSSINCEARVWVNYPNHFAFLETRHEIVIRIKEAFDNNGITIPFPIRTLDFGIKGGEKLHESLMVAYKEKEGLSNNPQ
jgi:small conductance mechanosensitive channel